MGWRDTFLEIPASPAVLEIIKLAVSSRVDDILNGVVTCRYCGYIPFELQDLATLEEMAKRDSEQVGNQDADGNGRCHDVILILLLALRLDAFELREEKGILRTCFIGGHTLRPQRGWFIVNQLLGLAQVSQSQDASLEAISRLTLTIIGIGHASGAILGRSHTDVRDVTNRTVLARKRDLADFNRDGLALVT